eukprot:5314063-Alexandrium_andersonii.AAC.1
MPEEKTAAGIQKCASVVATVSESVCPRMRASVNECIRVHICLLACICVRVCASGAMGEKELAGARLRACVRVCARVRVSV